MEAENTMRRAGFWRRIGSFVLDAVVVLLPLQVVVAVLFLLFFFALTACSEFVARDEPDVSTCVSTCGLAGALECTGDGRRICAEIGTTAGGGPCLGWQAAAA